MADVRWKMANPSVFTSAICHSHQAALFSGLLRSGEPRRCAIVRGFREARLRWPRSWTSRSRGFASPIPSCSPPRRRPSPTATSCAPSTRGGAGWSPRPSGSIRWSTSPGPKTKFLRATPGLPAAVDAEAAGDRAALVLELGAHLGQAARLVDPAADAHQTGASRTASWSRRSWPARAATRSWRTGRRWRRRVRRRAPTRSS